MAYTRKKVKGIDNIARISWSECAFDMMREEELSKRFNSLPENVRLSILEKRRTAEKSICDIEEAFENFEKHFTDAFYCYNGDKKPPSHMTKSEINIDNIIEAIEALYTAYSHYMSSLRCRSRWMAEETLCTTIIPRVAYDLLYSERNIIDAAACRIEWLLPNDLSYETEPSPAWYAILISRIADEWNKRFYNKRKIKVNENLKGVITLINEYEDEDSFRNAAYSNLDNLIFPITDNFDMFLLDDTLKFLNIIHPGETEQRFINEVKTRCKSIYKEIVNKENSPENAYQAEQLSHILSFIRLSKRSGNILDYSEEQELKRRSNQEIKHVFIDPFYQRQFQLGDRTVYEFHDGKTTILGFYSPSPIGRIGSKARLSKKADLVNDFNGAVIVDDDILSLLKRVHEAFSCSSMEFKGRALLASMNISFEPEKTFDECRNKRLLPFDLYFKIGGKHCLVEFDGEQHYKPIEYFGGEDSFKRTQENDNIKTQFAKENGFELLRIKYDEDVQKKLFDFINAIK